MTDSKRGTYYAERREQFMRKYWGQNDGTDLYLPNGIVKPDKVEGLYDCFCEQITHDGKVMDLGCGNGLMLKYLIEHTPFTLTPYGVDYLEPSIRQAKEMIHPEHESHFVVGNVMDYDYRDAPFDFIFADPYDVHPRDTTRFLQDVLNACADGGRAIFYTYHDVLEHYGYSWVGKFSGVSGLPIRRKDYPWVSFGVYDK